MRINITYLFISFLFLSIHFDAHCQKTRRVTGESKLKVESNISLDDAITEAINLAKINAIEHEFGSYVEQETNIQIQDNTTAYNIIGNIKVKGEWIETIGEPLISTNVTKEKTEYGFLNITWVECEITGRVRAISPKAMIDYTIMKSPFGQYSADFFISGEQMYVRFRSPVDGYLSIFLEDRNSVFRLLPYNKTSEGSENGFLVNNDVEYIFFSPEHKIFSDSYVDEIVMITEGMGIEYNFIYLIFSTDEFLKPILDNTSINRDGIIPKSLPKYEFDKWLSNNKSASNNFQIIKKRISIKNKNK